MYIMHLFLCIHRFSLLRVVCILYPFLAYFPYFEKNKVGLLDHVAICVCVCVCVCAFALLLLGNGLVKLPYRV
jgi:hypothetical protein